MTMDLRRFRGALLVVSVLMLAASCWGRSSTDMLSADTLPASLVEGYTYAQEKATDWCPTAFLEGASAGYRLRDSTWGLYKLSYVFADTERYEYIMVVLNLDDRVGTTHPPASIEGSLVTTSPFFLQDIAIQEHQALQIAEQELGSTVVQQCKDPELALRGSGSGENQFWDLTYTAYEPFWRVVGELSIDAVTGEVVVLKDFTHPCEG